LSKSCPHVVLKPQTTSRGDLIKLDFMKNSHRRIPAAQTAGPMYGVLIYDNNQTQSGV
jgi:hypothetical protein